MEKPEYVREKETNNFLRPYDTNESPNSGQKTIFSANYKENKELSLRGFRRFSR